MSSTLLEIPKISYSLCQAELDAFSALKWKNSPLPLPGETETKTAAMKLFELINSHQIEGIDQEKSKGAMRCFNLIEQICSHLTCDETGSLKVEVGDDENTLSTTFVINLLKEMWNCLKKNLPPITLESTVINGQTTPKAYFVFRGFFRILVPIKELGKGASGRVLKTIDLCYKKSRVFAMKISTNIGKLDNEYEKIMQLHQHYPNPIFINTYAVMRIGKNYEMEALFLELLDGDLTQLLLPNRHHRLHFCLLLIKLISDMHEQGHTHWDLKLRNIFFKRIPNGIVLKIGDLESVTHKTLVDSILNPRMLGTPGHNNINDLMEFLNIRADYKKLLKEVKKNLPTLPSTEQGNEKERMEMRYLETGQAIDTFATIVSIHHLLTGALPFKKIYDSRIKGYVCDRGPGKFDTAPLKEMGCSPELVKFFVDMLTPRYRKDMPVRFTLGGRKISTQPVSIAGRLTLSKAHEVFANLPDLKKYPFPSGGVKGESAKPAIHKTEGKEESKEELKAEGKEESKLERK